MLGVYIFHPIKMYLKITRNLTLGITAREFKDQKTVIKNRIQNKKAYCSLIDFYSQR